MRNYIDVIMNDFVGVYESIKHLYACFDTLHSTVDFEDFQSGIPATSLHFCFNLGS